MKRRLVIHNVGFGSQTEKHIIAWNLTLVASPKVVTDRHFKRNGQWSRVLIIDHSGVLQRRPGQRRSARATASAVPTARPPL
jgi:hypothetical protein